MKYKFLEHTADIKFRAFGNTAEEAFKNSGLAMKEAMAGKRKIRKKIKKEINSKGKDFESLLYNFLEEILYLLDAKKFIISEIRKIEIKKFALKAEITGDKADMYKFTNKVKAVTYNDMLVRKEKGKWICQVVLDV